MRHEAAVASHRSAAPLVRVPAFRATGVFGKDLIRHSRLVPLMTILSIAFLFLPLVPGLLKGGRQFTLSATLQNFAPTAYLGMLAACAYLFGLVLSSDESESETMPLLGSLPLRPLSLLLQKLGAATTLLLAWAFITLLVYCAFIVRPPAYLLSYLGTAPTGVSFMYYGMSGTVSLLQTAALLLTGLLAGILLRNVMASAIVGISLHFAYALALSYSVEGGTREIALPVITVGLAVWCGFILLVYPALFRRRLMPAGRTFARPQKLPAAWHRALSLRLFRRSYDAPTLHQLRVPSLCLVALSAICGFLTPSLHNSFIFVPSLFALLFLGALCGAGAFGFEERLSARGMVYTLPVGRSRLYWPRILTAVGGGALMAVAGVAALLAGLSLSTVRGLSQGDREALVSGVGVMFATSAVAVVPLAALLRLFYRSIVVAAALASVVTICWSAAAVFTVAGLLLTTAGPEDLLTGQWGAWVQIAWILLVPPALTAATGWIAFCRSRLLEAGESTRGRIGLAVTVLLLGWGSFLIGLSPAHLWILLVG